MATIHSKAGESTPGFEQRQRRLETEAEEEEAEAKKLAQREKLTKQRRAQRANKAAEPLRKAAEAAKLAEQKEWREKKQGQREKKREEWRTALRDAGFDPAQFNTIKDLEAAYNDLKEQEVATDKYPAALRNANIDPEQFKWIVEQLEKKAELDSKAPAMAAKAPSPPRQQNNYERRPLNNLSNNYGNYGDYSSEDGTYFSEGTSMGPGAGYQFKLPQFRRDMMEGATIESPMRSPSVILKSSDINDWTSGSGQQRANRNGYGNSFGPPTTSDTSVSYAQPKMTPGKSVAYAPTTTSDTYVSYAQSKTPKTSGKSVAYAQAKTPKTPKPVQTPHPPVDTPAAADRDFEFAPNSALRDCVTRQDFNFEKYGLLERERQLSVQSIQKNTQIGDNYHEFMSKVWMDNKEKEARAQRAIDQQMELLEEERNRYEANRVEIENLPHSPRLNANALGGRMHSQERRNNRLFGIGEDVADSTLGNEAFAEVSSNVLNYSGESVGDNEEVMDLASIFAEKCTVVESVKPLYKKNSLKYMKKDKLRSILDDMDQGYGKRDTNDDLRKQIWEAQREAAKKALSSIFGIKPEEKAKMDALLKKHGYID